MARRFVGTLIRGKVQNEAQKGLDAVHRANQSPGSSGSGEPHNKVTEEA
jgi:hypothetical protein